MKKSFSRNILSAAALSAVALALLPSCQDEEFGYSKEDIRKSVYDREFEKVFGQIDPNQTWNTASQVSLNVTVNFPGEYTVKVYTANPRYPDNCAYLAGQYDHITAGDHTFLCDLPATVDCAYVGLIDADGNRMILPAELTEHKGRVEFGNNTMTKAVMPCSEPFSVEKADKLVWTLTDLKAPLNTLPEMVNNTGKVTQNFEYVSMGSFTLYPVYCITSNNGGAGGDDFGEKLGIYTYDDWGHVIKNEDGSIKVTHIWHMNRGHVNTVDGVTSWDQINGTWFEAHNSNTNNWDQKLWFADTFEYSNASNTVWDSNANEFVSGYDKIRTEGIKVSLKSGTRFGFALKTDHGYVYSNSLYNLDEGGVGTDNLTPDHIRDTYAATFHDNGNLYLAFEDWGYGAWGHDCDFNDVVLRLLPTNGYNPIIIDKDMDANPMLYIVACEDLGGTFDWDFNDVVFGIEHVSGQTKARVKLLAAGGTLPVSLKFCDNENEYDITFGSENLTDLHAAFDAETGQPVNVEASYGVTRDPIYSNEFSVNENSFNILEDAQNFRICVTYKDGTSQNEIHVPVKDGVTRVPQAFLISDPTWKWPIELQDIRNKYKDFEAWVSNMHTNWTETSWGLVRENGAIPSYANNILTQFYGVLGFGENNITFPIKHDQMGYNATYKLVVMVSESAVASFKDGNGNKISALADGNLTADRYITFTLNPDVVKVIKDQQKDGLMTITFDHVVTAESNPLMALFWYEASAKPSPNLAVSSDHEIVMSVGETSPIRYATDNRETDVRFTSNNQSVAMVDENTGIISGVSIGDATITVSQSGSEHFNAATSININVKVMEKSVISLTTERLELSTFDSSHNSAAIQYATNNAASAVTFLSSDENVATVDAYGNVTAKKTGITTISVNQNASSYYLAADPKEVTVWVNYDANYGYRISYENARKYDNEPEGYQWVSVTSGGGGIKELLGWNVSNGVKLTFDYAGITDINNLYIESWYTPSDGSSYSVQVKGDKFMNCDWDDQNRKLSVVISKENFEKYFQDSSNEWHSHVYVGGWAPKPVGIYVSHP